MRCPAIEVHDLTKSYRDRPVVEALSFEVEPGRITGFLGPNGAGKSTTMRLMVGLDHPDRGRATFDGQSYRSLPRPASTVGAVLDTGGAHPGRRALDHLRWMAAAEGLPDRRAAEVRGRLLASKVAVFGALSTVAGVSAALGTFLVSQALLSSSVPHASLGDPTVLRAVLLTGVYLPLAGLLALGLGAIIRNTAGAIAAFVGVVLVLPGLIAPLPGGVRDTLLQFTPGDILTSFLQPVSPPTHSLDPWLGLAVLVAYVAAALVVGAALMIRRDA